MRRILPFIILTLAFAALPAKAQTPRAPKPYEPVAITRPAALEDASFTAFRLALAAVAKRRLYAELTPLVLTQGFFWDRDFGQRVRSAQARGGQSRRRDRARRRQRRRLGGARELRRGRHRRAAPLPPRCDLRTGPPRLRQRGVLQTARQPPTPPASTGPIRARTTRRCARRPQPDAAEARHARTRISSGCSASKALTARPAPAATCGRVSPCRTARRASLPPAA